MNWSTMTNSPGAKSSRSEPTAETETMSVTPARFMRVDVGAVVDVRRRKLVAAAVARQEAELQPAELGEEDVVGGRAPRPLDPLPLGALQTRQGRRAPTRR